MNDSIQHYLNDIARYPLLTREQEILLGRSVRRWKDSENPTPKEVKVGKKAFDKLINCNLRLVVSIAKKYRIRSKKSDLMDLIQEGNIGLSQAVRKFDPERGYAFSTYAFWWVRQGVTRYLSQADRMIRLPGNANDQIVKLRYWIPLFQTENGRMPTLEECADYTGVPARRLEGYMVHINDACSLDSPVYTKERKGEDNMTILDSIADLSREDPLDALAWNCGAGFIEDMIAELPIKEQVILENHFGLKGKAIKSLTAIGQDLGISRERVRQLESKALIRMRLRAAGAKVRA